MTFFLLLAAVVDGAVAVELSARPQPVLIEESATARSLNFDLLIRNPTDTPLDVDEIKISVYDRSGALVHRARLQPVPSLRPRPGPGAAVCTR